MVFWVLGAFWCFGGFWTYFGLILRVLKRLTETLGCIIGEFGVILGFSGFWFIGVCWGIARFYLLVGFDWSFWVLGLVWVG